MMKLGDIMADEINSTNQANEQNRSAGIPPFSVTPPPQMPKMPSPPPDPPSIPSYSSPSQAPKDQPSGSAQPPASSQNGPSFIPGSTPHPSLQTPYYQQPPYIPGQVPPHAHGGMPPPYGGYPQPNGSFSPYPPQHYSYVPRQNRGFSVASLVLGICSVVLYSSGYLSVIMAILAFVFGIIGIKKGGSGMAIAGIITGIIGFALSVFILIMMLTSIGNILYGQYGIWEDHEDEFMRSANMIFRLFHH